MKVLDELERRVKEVRKEKEILAKKIVELKSEIDELKEKFELIEKRTFEIESEQKKREEEFFKLYKELKSALKFSSIISKLLREVDELGIKVKEQERGFEILRKDLEEKVRVSAEQNLKKLESKFEDLEKKISEIEERIDNLKFSLKVLSENYRNLLSEFKKLSSNFISLASTVEEKLKIKSMEIAEDLKDEIKAEVEEKFKERIRKILELEKDLSNLKNLVESSYEIFKKRLKQMEENLENLSRLKNLREEFLGFQSKVRKFINTTVDDVENKLNKFNSLILDLNNRLLNLQQIVRKSQPINLEKRIRYLEEKFEVLNQTVSDLSKRFEGIFMLKEKFAKTEDLEKLYSKFNYLSSILDELKFSVGEEKNARERIEEKIREIEIKIQEISKLVDKDAIGKLDLELGSLKRKIEGFSTQVENKISLLVKLREDLKDEIEKAKERLKAVESRLVEVEDESKELANKTREMERKLDEKVEEIRKEIQEILSKDIIRNLTLELRTLKERIQAFSSRMGELENKISSFERLGKDLNDGIIKTKERLGVVEDGLQEVKSMAEKISKVEDKFKELMHKFSSLENKTQEMERRFSETRQTLETLMDRISEIKNSAMLTKSLRSEIEQIEETLKTLEDAIKKEKIEWIEV